MEKAVYSSDQDIVIGIIKNDDRALLALYKMHFNMVAHLVLNNNGTEQEAKDIYQEAIIHLYEKIKNNQLELTCKIKTYLYSVCRRLWLKKLMEKSKYCGKIEDFESFIEVEQDSAQIEENEKKYGIMTHSLTQLGEPCKTLIEDFYIQSLSMEHISEKFGYTNSDNAKNQKYKCLQRLKKIFFSTYIN